MVTTPEFWRESRTISQNSPGIANTSITQLAGGDILLAWESSNATGAGSPFGDDVIARRMNLLGDTLGGEFRANRTFSIDDEGRPSISPLADGGYLVVYVDDNTSSSGLRYDRYDADGVHVTGGTVDFNGTVNYYVDHHVVALGANQAIFYIENTTTDGLTYDRLMVRIFDPATNTQTAEAIVFQNVTNNDDITSLDAATLTDGRAVVVAGADFAGDNEIWFEVLDTDGTQSGIRKVVSTDGDGDNDRDPQVTALANGGFVISWTNTDNLDTDIVFALFDSASNQIGGQRFISTGSTDDLNESQVVGLLDGGFLVIYDDDGGDQLLARRFDAGGNQIGVPLVIATGAGATEPQAVLLEDGRVAVSYYNLGAIRMTILDTRETPETGTYLGGDATVGTIRDDIATASGSGIFYGWRGNDLITDGSGLVDINAGGGNDTVRADTINAAEVFDGRAGVDTLELASGFGAGQNVTVNLTNETMASGASVQTVLNFENVIGGLSDDHLVGTAGANRLEGMLGADRLFGQGGNDRLYGGDGNDTLFGNDGADLLNGELNNDNLSGGNGADTLNGGGGNDTIAGGDSGDRVLAGAGHDVVNGGMHSDWVNGNSGNDTINGAHGADTLLGADGNDSISGDRGNDWIEGNLGNDFLRGADASDTLNGAGGNDTLEGGRGQDVLTGGGQTDLFIFAGNIGQDIVTDFQDNVDVLDFSGQNQMNSFADFTANASQVGTDVVLTLLFGNQVTFQGVALGQFDASDFIF